MIRLQDAAMLAFTKLRTRKVRLAVTIIISGLLFSALTGASFVMRGAINGVSSFSKEGLGSRYIVSGNGQPSFGFMNDKTTIDRAVAIQKDLIARKKAAAKDLGITYDPAVEVPAMQEYNDPSGTKHQTLNPTSDAARQAIQEYLAAHPLPGIPEMKAAAEPYHAKTIYTSQMFPYDFNGGQVQVLKDGKETFNTAEEAMKGSYSPPSGLDSFINSWTAMSSELLQPFLLPEQNLQVGKDGSIPIIVPRSAAEQILGLKALPASASANDRLERTKEMRRKVAGVTFQVCYRNSQSASLVSQAISTQQEIEQNKDKKGYQKPELIYGLPTTPCGSVPVTRDIRSSADKKLADKQQTFNQMFGQEPEQSEIWSFRVVGVVPDLDYFGGALSVSQVVRTLVTSSLGAGWFMPSGALDANTTINKLFTTPSIFGSVPSYYAEFGSADMARDFIDKTSCNLDYSKLGSKDPQAVCTAQHKPFVLNPFGSNSLALESAGRNFAKYFRIAALAVSAIAAIIMMGTVGRMIADSRRETAVFRAIGAKKLDIAQIYIIYAICLSLLIALFACVIGLVFATFANHRLSAELTVEAINAFNANDLTKTIKLYGFYAPDLLLLIGLSVAAGLLSAVLPLFRNLRRNPIRDMRDDT